MMTSARKAAAASGAATYLTGLPCPAGHVAERRTRNGECVECARASKRKAYLENTENALARAAQYRESNRAEINRKAAEKYWSDPAAGAARVRDWYSRNRETILEKERSEYLEKRASYFSERYKRDRDRIARVRAAYSAANPEKINSLTAARRARKSEATPPWADLEKIEEVYWTRELYQKERGAYLEVDHIIPLRSKTVCGLHVHWNLRVIPGEDNLRKGNRYQQQDALAFVTPGALT